MFEDFPKPPPFWTPTITVECAWGQVWSRDSIPRCVDIRECFAPPEASETVGGQVEGISAKRRDTETYLVNSTFWYACKDVEAVFLEDDGSVMDDHFVLTCVNDGTGRHPFWAPEDLYDPFFPVCAVVDFEPLNATTPKRKLH